MLAYHRIGTSDGPFRHVDARQFEAQMRWLRRHCSIVDPAKLRSSRPPERRPAVAITFDDGYGDYREHAYPILRELQIPAAVFLSTDFTDRGGMFWWDRVHYAVHVSRLPRVRLPWAPYTEYGDSDAERTAFRKACTRFIGARPAAEQQPLVDAVCVAAGVDPATALPRQVMTWDDVRQTMEFTRYGGHTHTHVRVSRTDEQTLDREVRMCRERIRAETGTTPHLFAYPIGDTCDMAKRILTKHGFDTAFSMEEEVYVPKEVDWLDVPRFPGPDTIEELAWIASGWARDGSWRTPSNVVSTLAM